MNNKITWIGIAFAFLWASASTATKISLQTTQPFVIALSRFLIAGCIMIFVTHCVLRQPLPAKTDWKKLLIYGLLNISFYLGLYVVAMQKISAGLGTLAVCVNPVFISFIAAIVFRQHIAAAGYVSLLLCCAGVFIAAWPLLQTSYASAGGIALIMASMFAYSAGAVYYSRTQWNGMHILTINGWQTLLGGMLLLPVLLLTYQSHKNNFDFHFWSGTLWLAIPVSIGAVQCWLLLLKHDTVKAAYWLFLCPVFGFLIAWAVLKEPLSLYSLVGVILVIAGLYIAQQFKISAQKE